MESALRNLTERELNSLELIETFRFSPDEGFVRLAMHLRRMEKSAAAFKISFDRDDALRVLKRVGGETALRDSPGSIPFVITHQKWWRCAPVSNQGLGFAL